MIVEAQFQPLYLDGADKVVVLLKNPDHTPQGYDTHVVDGKTYVIIDPDYSGFFNEQRFRSATEALRDCGTFSHITHIVKVYLPNHVLYKEHPVQHYLPGGKVNPQYEPDKVIYTISVGSDEREEVIKYAWNSAMLE